MSSYEHIDDLRGVWRGLGQERYTSQPGDSEARRLMEYVRRSERRSVASRLVRRHIMLGILGCLVLPADMWFTHFAYGLPLYLIILLTIYGIFAGASAFWVAWSVNNFDFGGLTMREAWHKANVLYLRRNMLRNISLCVGIPLVIILIMAFGEALGRPAMVGGIVGGVIGGAIGVYLNWRTQKQMREMRDTFDEDD